MDKLTKVLDLKSRPPEFTGAQEQWDEFVWKLDLTLSMAVPQLQNEMRQAATMTTQAIIAAEAADPGMRERSAWLYKILATSCHNKALSAVRLQPQQRGLAA